MEDPQYLKKNFQDPACPEVLSKKHENVGKKKVKDLQPETQQAL